MRTVQYKTEVVNLARVEELKLELNSVGINSFSIDFCTNQISVNSLTDINEEEITCALIKAGFRCRCISTRCTKA